MWAWSPGNASIDCSLDIWSLLQQQPPAGEPSLHHYLELAAPEERRRVASVISRAVGKGIAFEVACRLNSLEKATAREARIEGQPLFDASGQLRCYAGSIHPLVKRKSIRCEQEFSLDELKAMYANIPGSFSIMSADGSLLAWNDFMREDIVGSSDEAMQEADGFSTIHPDDQAFMQEQFAKVLTEGKEVFGEARILLRGGPNFVWRAIHGKRIMIDGQPCVMAIGANIDRQKRMAELQAFRLHLQGKKEHADVEELVRAALDEAERLTGSQSGFCSFTAEEHSLEHLMVWSSNARELFGSADVEDGHLPLKDSPFFSAMARERKPMLFNNLHASSPAPDFPGDHGQIKRLILIPLMGQTGVTALFGLANKPTDYSEDELQLATLLAETAWDIIGKKRAEESEGNLQKHCRQFQELGLVGQLAGGVVHEFNTMLAVALEHTEHLLETTGEDDPARSALDAIHDATSRNLELAVQLLSFAEKSPGSHDIVNINAVVDEMLEMLEHLAPAGVRLRWNPREDELWAQMDPGQLELVLVNLFLNACEAIEGSGEITITSGSCSIAPSSIRASDSCRSPGDYATLSLTDTGCGIASELLPNIFDPFFTTKGSGEQKGLGLSTVYGVVRQANGCVDVKTEEGAGTTITISLPRTAGIDIPLPFQEGRFSHEDAGAHSHFP